MFPKSQVTNSDDLNDRSDFYINSGINQKITKSPPRNNVNQQAKRNSPVNKGPVKDEEDDFWY